VGSEQGSIGIGDLADEPHWDSVWFVATRAVFGEHTRPRVLVFASSRKRTFPLLKIGSLCPHHKPLMMHEFRRGVVKAAVLAAMSSRLCAPAKRASLCSGFPRQETYLLKLLRNTGEG